MGLAYRFRGLVQCHHGGKHSGVWVVMVLKKLRVVYLDRQAGERETEVGGDTETDRDRETEERQTLGLG